MTEQLSGAYIPVAEGDERNSSTLEDIRQRELRRLGECQQCLDQITASLGSDLYTTLNLQALVLSGGSLSDVVKKCHNTLGNEAVKRFCDCFDNLRPDQKAVLKTRFFATLGRIGDASNDSLYSIAA